MIEQTTKPIQCHQCGSTIQVKLIEAHAGNADKSLHLSAELCAEHRHAMHEHFNKLEQERGMQVSIGETEPER